MEISRFMGLVRNAKISFHKIKHIALDLVILLNCLFLYNCTDKIESDKEMSQLYSETEKEYFMQTFFSGGKTAKWISQNITFSINGEFNRDQASYIINTLGYISTLKGLPKFQHVQSDAKIKFIMASPGERFKSRKGDHWQGYTSLNKGFLGRSLISCEIYVKSTLTEFELHRTLQHEILHALGLSGHPKSTFAFSSALGVMYFTNLDPQIPQNIPVIDSKALMLLYDRRIPAILTRSYFSKLLGIK